MHVLKSGRLVAHFAPRGAELKSLRTAAGPELIWHGDPQWWGYSAPLLFPVIGPVAADGIKHEGHKLKLKSHGFARDQIFSAEEVSPSCISFSLRDSADTRKIYPFSFLLAVTYTILNDSLVEQVTIENTGRTGMPASFGFHPALSWPISNGGRALHLAKFSRSETGATYCVNADGEMESSMIGMGPELDELLLEDSLFENGALVIDRIASSSLTYGDLNGPIAEIGWSGCTQLGIWSKQGAPFVCFEPWRGHPSPAGFRGSLSEKPGSFSLAPGEKINFGLTFTPLR